MKSKLSYAVLIVIVLLSGCTSETPELQEKVTPELTSSITTPAIETTEEKETPETPEIQIPEVILALGDSSSIVSESTIDKLFIISHEGGESIPAANLKIEVYDSNQKIIDTLEYKSSSKSFEGKYLKSTAFFDEKLDSGDTIAVLETPAFFNLKSHTVLNVKVIYLPASETLVKESVEII